MTGADTVRRLVGAACIALSGEMAASARAGQRSTSTPADLLADRAVRAAIEAVRNSEPQTIDDQIRLCEVPAPVFHESARGQVVKQAFEQLGLRDVRVDAVGNVLGERPGMALQPHVVLSAHLDTVFPDGTDVKVRREGSVLYGPGIGDDCRGLAVVLAVARALMKGEVQTPGRITFAATVGEEGLGDLRGVRGLFSRSARLDVNRFVSIDGTGLGVTTVGVGSVRYRVTFKGPGGHSFAAFGLPNPIGAMGRAIERLGDLPMPSTPKTTLNVGRVGGGTSVNSIPAEAWMEVDLRSTDAATLASTEARFLAIVDAAVAAENDRSRSGGAISVVKERVGNRPAAATAAGSAIVRAADAVNRVLGIPTSFNESSTDANIPMSLNIPAITIGGGGRGSDAHALTESFDTSDSWRGTERALLLTMVLAQK
jgi:acetylornithine deacetylase/succinyl-diaminopimelate desuccinylase-like protein